MWIAYDRPSAFGRFLLISGGIAMVWAMAWSARRHRRQTLHGIVLVAATALVLLSAAHLTHALPAGGLTGSSLVVLLPIVAGGASASWQHGRRKRAVAMGLALVVGLATLAFTDKVSAWSGLLAGSLVAGAWAGCGNKAIGPVARRMFATVVVTAILTAAALYGMVVFTSAADAALSSLAFGPKLMSRIDLWRESLTLIQDYPITGSGLGNTAMALSSYVFFLHVPYYYHAHNLYLQIAIEQGLLGLTAFAGMSLTVLWGMAYSYTQTTPDLRRMTVGTVGALGSVLATGLFDATLYVSSAAPLLFVPIGVAIVLQSESSHSCRGMTAPRPVYSGGITFVVMTLVGAIASFVWLMTPGGQSRAIANWGAVAQTQVELSVYRQDEWPIQDLLRRNNIVDLSQAETLFTQALHLDAQNITAHRRLGQIALSRGDYAGARTHLEAAHHAHPAEAATRRLLGEVYAVTGLTDVAVLLWRTQDLETPTLQTRLWWYTSRGAQTEAQGIRQAIERLE